MQTTGISFFYKTKKASGIIRGEQISSYVGAKKNPENNFIDDVCVFVKKQPFENFPKLSYLDIIDGSGLVDWAKKHPTIGIIAISEIAKNYLSEKLNRKDIKLIPEHHCNYERTQRASDTVKNVGYIGYKRSLRGFTNDIMYTFAKYGFNFKSVTNFNTRLDVVNFYKSIDIQISFRDKTCTNTWHERNLKNPLKLANAGSFGIPTVCYPELNYQREFKD